MSALTFTRRFELPNGLPIEGAPVVTVTVSHQGSVDKCVRGGSAQGRGGEGMSDLCMIEGCENPHKNRDKMCSMHRARVTRHGDPHYTTPRVRVDPVERFWEKVDRRGDDECWPWLGTILATGYGQFRVRQQHHLAHRYSYEIAYGPIPEGLHLDHVRDRGCRMTRCVNPAHLEAVTPTENWRRSVAPNAIALRAREGAR